MRRVLAGQIGLGAVISAVLWGMYGSVYGYSALLGCLIATLPNAFLAARLAMSRARPNARALLRAAWVGELGKLALTVLLFSIVFVAVRPLAAAPLFAVFIITALVPIAGLLVGDNSNSRKTVDYDGK
ncbi:MAG: ATP synthase subunit I [Woeseiaceae bacterium]|nr:ATP synthase subunit I [Woeseiaceae bacterium]